jgi:hypothetical protein
MTLENRQQQETHVEKKKIKRNTLDKKEMSTREAMRPFEMRPYTHVDKTKMSFSISAVIDEKEKYVRLSFFSSC